MRSASTNHKKPQVLPQTTKLPKIPQPNSHQLPPSKPKVMPQNGKIFNLKSSSSPTPTNFTKPSSKSSLKSLKTMPQTVRGNSNQQNIKVLMNQNAKLNGESLKTEPNSKNNMQNIKGLRENVVKIIRQNTQNTKIIQESIKEETLKQEIAIKPSPAFPVISWDDFQAEPVEDSWFLAQIYWGVSYNTKVKDIPAGFKVEVCAYCYINKARSWVKSEYEELLEHEQGHFNIGHLCALAFQKKVQRTKFNPKNYRQEVQRMYDENMREYCEMERNYDKETCHMMDSEMQRKWKNDLQEKLKELSG